MPARLRQVLRSGVFLWALITVLFFWKVTLTKQYIAFDDPDMAHQVMPWWHYEAAQLHRGSIPLWEPHHWLGQPLVGQGQPGVMYPLNYLFLLVPRKNGFVQTGAMHWYFVVIHFLAGLAMYWLCRDQKLSRLAAIAAASIYGFSGIFGQLSWPQMLNGAVWAPLVLLFALRVIRGDRVLWNGVCAGVMLGMAWLSGHHQIPIFLTLMLAGLLGYAWWRDARLRFGLVLLAAFGTMFFVSAAQTLPAWEYGHDAVRWVGAPDVVGWKDVVPYNVHHQFSIPPLNLLNIVLPGYIGGPSLFVGLIAMSLALVGALKMWRMPAVPLAAAVAGGGLAWCVGGFLLFQGVIYALLPMVEKARTPSMASCVFTMGIALLAAFGVEALLSLLSPGTLKPFPQVLAIIGALLALPFYWRVAEAQGTADGRWFAGALLLLIFAAIAQGWQSGAVSRSAAAGLALLLLISDLSLGLTYSWPHRNEPGHGHLKRIADQADIAQFLKSKQPAVFRFMVDGDQVPYNLGDQYGLDQLNGYLASITTNVREMEIGSDRVERLLNTRYYVGKEGFRNMTQEVFASRSGLKVFEDPETYPRAFALQEVRVVKDRAEVGRILSNSDVNLRNVAVTTEKVPALTPCPTNPEGKFDRASGNRITVDITTECRQMVLVSEAWDRNWKAWVDDREVPIYELDLALRGVIVPPGKHRIKMAYRPTLVYAGAVLSVVTLLGVWLLRKPLRRLELYAASSAGALEPSDLRAASSTSL